jgi:hypothetical protein
MSWQEGDFVAEPTILAVGDPWHSPQPKSDLLFSAIVQPLNLVLIE